MDDHKTVGNVVLRKDDYEKVTGRAVYTDDIKLRDMLHGAVLYSAHTHAQILSIDTSAAEALPGVRAVVTGKDYPNRYGSVVVDRPFFAVDKVRHRGEPVAAVAAVDKQTAEYAVKLIKVEYKPLRTVLDPIEAFSSREVLVHEDLADYKQSNSSPGIPGSNVCCHYKLRKGDVEKGFAAADLVLEATYNTPMIQHGALETHVAIASMEHLTGKLTVWTSSVSAFNVRRELADALNIPMGNIRVILPFVGGSFGSKMYIKAEVYAVALAMKADAPVKLVLNRCEEFGTAVKGPTVSIYKTGVKKDGTIIARQVTTYWDTGAYADCGPSVCMAGGHASPGPYNIPNSSVDGYVIYTNKNISCAFRGYGVQETSFAYETHTDDVARALGMDPLDFRLKNLLREGDCSSTGQIIDSGGIVECTQKAAEAIDWYAPKKPFHGKGIASIQKGAAGPSTSCALIKMNEDATTYQLIISTVEQGQGSNTAMCMIAAEELGISVDSINVSPVDTDYSPFDPSTTGSKAIFCMGNAIRLAALDLKQKARKRGAEYFGVPEKDIILDLMPAGGSLWPCGREEEALTLRALMIKQCGGRSANIMGEGIFTSSTLPEDPATGQTERKAPFWMFGAQAAEVEVNPETGRITILKLTAAHDVGRAINPRGCSQQIEGALIQGLSGAMLEAVNVDNNGLTVNPNLSDYKMISSMDVPPVYTTLVETTHPDGPFGAKGVGEPALAPVAPAIANAVSDAIGVRIRALPLTPEKVLEAIRGK